MKVAMLTNTEEACGIAAYSRSLDAELAQIVDLDVVPTWRQAQAWEEFVQASLPRLNACDVVHVQHEYSFWGSIIPKWGRFVGRFADYASRIKPPIVLTAHTLDTVHEMFGLDKPGSGPRRMVKQFLASFPPYRDAIERRTFSIADRIIIHDPHAISKLTARGIPELKIRMIPMGIPATDMNPIHTDAFRTRFNLQGRRLIVVFGFVRQGRGYEAAMDILPGLGPDVTLVIAGGPQTNVQRVYMDSLAEQVRARGLGDRVVITGYLPDDMVSGAMQAADIVLCSQEAGTGSYSVQVALAYGRPIVASDLPCFAYPEQTHGCLMTFRRGDAQDMASKLKSVRSNPGLSADLSARALRYAAEHTWREIAQKTLEVYRELV